MNTSRQPIINSTRQGLLCMLLFMMMAIFECAESEETTTSASLETIKNCPALLTELRETAIKDMEAKLDANLKLAIQGRLCPYLEGVGLSGDLGSAPDTKSATQYSKTNVQVMGVDEADFVKNDGSYIYILANGKFRIIDSWPPEKAFELSTFNIEGTPKKMFVHNGQAFIYSSLNRIVQNQNLPYAPTKSTECTYGYDCDFTGDGRELKITVLDISQVTAPRLVREMRFNGAYLNSRRINNAVHTVVIFPEPHISGLKYWPDEIMNGSFCQTKPSEAQITAAFKSLKEKNRKLIQSAKLDNFLPTMKDVRYKKGVSQKNPDILANCNTYYRSTHKDGSNFLSIISTKINGTASVHATTIMGKPGAVYALKSALYVSARHSQNTGLNTWYFDRKANINEASTIHKFSLSNNDNPASQYQASGVVKGRVLNQFSMDEFKGFFRIATTSGHLPNPKTHSTISILEQKEENSKQQLVVVGQIDNIAPTEDIRSARFMGDKGFIVTFKKTDPLFVFDLSDPYQPKIAGELKIPGFSTYMHRIDDKHLLTIGYDAEDKGKYALFQGIMLQIFDVSDMTKPTLTHKEVIGTRGSTSEAATNHLAFNYFGSKELLAIPMTICEREARKNGFSYLNIMKFSGLLVYKINVDNGFKLLGGVPHISPESKNKFRNMCNNWWTQSNSYVKRSVFMDDYVFSITEDTIKVNRLSALGKDLAVIYFADKSKCDPLHLNLCASEQDCSSNNGQWKNAACHLPLYSPVRSLNNFTKLCTASYDSQTKKLNIPCVNVVGTQYKAVLSLVLPSSPVQLSLTSGERAAIRLAQRGCEVVYNANTGNLRVPCINIKGNTALYWGNFKVLNKTPFTMELTGSGAAAR